MQSNNSSPIKAARRAIRAEATLIFIIVIITSWSLYALYKIATNNSNTIFEFNIDRNQDSAVIRNITDRIPRIFASQQETVSSSQPVLYTQPVLFKSDNQEALKNQMIQEILGDKEHSLKTTDFHPVHHEYIPSNHKEVSDTFSYPARSNSPQNQLSNEQDYDYIPAPVNLDDTAQLAPSNNTLEDDQPSIKTDDDQSSTTAKSDEEPAEDQQQEASPSSVSESAGIESSDDPDDGENTMTAEEAEKLDDTPPEESGFAIDEEVDRMTQPSISDAKQHPVDANVSAQYRNTVQFDDSLNSGSLLVSPSKDLMYRDKKTSGQLEPESLIATFVDPESKPRPTHESNSTTHIKNSDHKKESKKVQNRRQKRSNQSDIPKPVARPSHTRSNEPQAANSLYTVDHGLLLYPTEESHEAQKSMSKKEKMHKGSKKKKKMTIAMKKGGHKKKKHKKEEKKYLKEKKFKGAKKGKKMSKGKGGQGGKKGKKLYKDKGFKKKGFKNVYHKEEFGQKKSYFDEFRDKDFKKKWKKFDDKYNYAQMKKWQAKDVKGAKKMKDQGGNFKKYDKSKWKKKYQKHYKEDSKKGSMKKKKEMGSF